MKQLNTYITEALIKKHVDVKKSDIEFIDLELPSGTLWAAYDGYETNSDKYCIKTWNEARDEANNDITLPSYDQVNELINNTTISFDDKFRIVRKSKINGQIIVFHDSDYWVNSENGNSAIYFSINKLNSVFKTSKFSVRYCTKI